MYSEEYLVEDTADRSLLLISFTLLFQVIRVLLSSDVETVMMM